MNKNIKNDYFFQFSRKTLRPNFKANNLYHEKDCPLFKYICVCIYGKTAYSTYLHCPISSCFNHWRSNYVSELAKVVLPKNQRSLARFGFQILVSAGTCYLFSSTKRVNFMETKFIVSCFINHLHMLRYVSEKFNGLYYIFITHIFAGRPVNSLP